ncbi:MAG: hypothetical protein NTZ02_03740 [Candidatus Woesearchaeota archaeon]|nr:hypothetical protein [Candidatus Woesearchaeota archaeon]
MNEIKNIGRWMFLIVLAVSVLFISGCSSYGGGSLFNAHTGSEALRVSFMDNAPPAMVYSGSAFTVGVLLENYGAYEIDDGTLIIGTDIFEKSMLTGKDSAKFSLSGREDSRTFIGGRDAKFFSMKAPDIGSENEQEATISIKTCYKYTTTAQTSVCIDKSMYNADNVKSACTFKNQIRLSSEGAPVVVNEIDVARIFKSNTEVQFSFTIHISNDGRGVVVNRADTSNFCSSSGSLGPSAFGRATVSSAALGTENLDCSPRNYVDLSQNDKDFVTCTSKIMDVSNSAYVTSLKINVTYGYVNMDSTTIRILRLNS